MLIARGYITIWACQDGESISVHGQWKSGCVVPYLGIVRMGSYSFVCKVRSGSVNPPMQVFTDWNGNLLTYADGGYVLTGEFNSAEYEIVATDGEPGKPGNDGQPGLDLILRDSEWHAGVKYHNDKDLRDGIRFLDIALIENQNNDIGYDCYMCLQTHISTAINKPGSQGGIHYWKEMSGVGPMFTSLVIAKNANIKFLQGNRLYIQKAGGTITAGISGSSEGDKTRFWAGSNTPDNAPFAVNEYGHVIAEKFSTGRRGCRMVAQDGVIDIFGNVARNIQFGVNADGMAVLRYYDNNGNLLYDLGPSGIKNVEIREESWKIHRWTFLATSIDTVFDNHIIWRKACTPEYNTGADIYQYHCKMVAGVEDDPENNGKYFISQNKIPENRVQDGWYVKAFPLLGPADSYPRIEWNGAIPGLGTIPDNIHPKNPQLNGYEKIYVESIFYLSSGKVVKRQDIYYNLSGIK